MNVNLNTSTALASAAGQVTGNDAGTSVLKKALDSASQNAMQLINAVPKTEKTATNLPPNLGQNINTTA